MKDFYFMFPAIAAAAILFILCPAPAAFAVEVLGHRGAAFYAPENTLTSIKKALEMDVDGVEIDVYLTKDNKVAVIHDENTKRISGGAADLKVAEATSRELKKIDAGGYKGVKFKGEKIPLLEEVLEIMPPDKKLFIEIKCGAEIFQSLCPIIEKSGRADKIAIISFSLDAAALSKILLPRCGSYWILDTNFFMSAKIEDAIEIAVKNNLDGLDLDHKLASSGFIKKTKDAGLKFYVWTVDAPQTAVVLKSYGLDGITSNKPDIIIKAVK